jgi:hypothetical protein
MRDNFMTPAEIIKFFEKGRLKEDNDGGECISICSVGDILDVCEAFKKGGITLSLEELMKRFQEFTEKDTGPVNSGLVFIVDLEQENLFHALFEREEGLVNGFWIKASNSNISPRRSIRYLTIRNVDGYTWWSEDVYMQMEEYHASLR